MIVLTVISLNGTSISNEPTFFDELGGTIGRLETNQLVLPDTERVISRTHAQVVFRGGRFALIDRGSNAVVHNGRPLGNGNEAFLAPGDEIQIGGYLISVTSGAAAKVEDPFADFDFDDGTKQKPAGVVPMRDSPVGVSKAGSKAGAMHMSSSGLVGSGSGGGIPDDWDPFATDDSVSDTGGGLGLGWVRHETGAPVAFDQPAGRPAELLVSAPSSYQSLDALFGLSADSPVGDPLAGSALTTSPKLSTMPGDEDPLQSMQGLIVDGGATPHDHDSDLKAPWHDMPRSQKSLSPVESILPGVVLSWDQPPRDEKIAVQKEPVIPAPVSSIAQRSDTGLAQGAGRVLQAPVSRTQGESGASGTSVEGGLLMKAFLDGLGVPDLRIAPLSPETMFQLGQLMRESTQGAVELLSARTAIKKEVRAEVTVMGATANNAMKFSPTVEFALQYLLGPKTPGFMGPVESMRDTFDDLKAHQLGVMAGMRAALSEVLKRFDPAVLEGKLAPRSALASLLPSGRKAQLWELFQQLFGQLVIEAEDDFDELFGRAFVREYERCVAQLNSKK